MDSVAAVVILDVPYVLAVQPVHIRMLGIRSACSRTRDRAVGLSEAVLMLPSGTRCPMPINVCNRGFKFRLFFHYGQALEGEKY